MRFLEMAQQIEAQARSAGGPRVLRLNEPTPPGPADADPRWRPVPDPVDGSLVVDPGFSLPTTAGPLAWRLFYGAVGAEFTSAVWGANRSASAPVQLTNQVLYVYVTHEDGSVRQYVAQEDGSYRVSPDQYRNGDTLTYDAISGWDETHADTGLRYHFPLGNTVRAAYRATPQGLRLTYNYGSGNRLESVVEPAGRRLTLSYNADAQVQVVQDPSDRGFIVLTYAGGDLTEVWEPEGVVTRYRYNGSHGLSSIVDPEGFITTYTYSGGAVRTRDVAGSVSTYTYQISGLGVVTYAYTDALGATWTHVSLSGKPTGQIDPLGGRQTYLYLNTVEQRMSPLYFTDELGRTVSFSYNEAGLINGERDALGAWRTFTLDEYNNTTSVQDPLGQVTTYDFGPDPSLRQLRAEINALGYRTSYTYLANGLPETVEDPLGYRTTWVWSSLGLLEQEINALGYRRTYAYDLMGNRTAEVDPLGNRWTFVSDKMGREVATQNPLGFRHTMAYDTRGQVRAEIDALGNRTTFLWHAFGSPTGQINALGNRTTTVYNLTNQPVAQIDALGNRISFYYDTAARLVAVEDALGYRTSTVWDAVNQPIASIDALGYRTSTQYDLAGRAEAVQDARGYWTTSVFNALGLQVAEIDALGARSTTVFDALGQVAGWIDPRGFRSTTQYDGRGLEMVHIDALGYRSSLAYSAIGELVGVQDARGNRTTTLYDAASYPIAEVDALGYRTSASFDAAGQQIAIQNPLGYRVSTEYDQVERVQAVINELGVRWTALYDALGRPTADVDGLGFRRTTVFDARDAVIAAQDERGYRTTMVDDANGRRVAVLDASGNRISLAYDGRGSLIASQDQLGALTTWQFDPVGNEAVRIEASGTPTTYLNDPVNLRVGTLYLDGTRVTATFDSAGYQTSLEDRTGATSYHYDAVGRMTQVVSPVVGSPVRLALTTSYDEVGNRILLLDPAGGRTSYGFDSRNLISIITNPYGERTTVEHDGLTREVRKTLGNGMTVSHVYDAAGRECVRETRDASGAAIAVFTASYDTLANRTSLLELDGARLTYLYDPDSQLVREERSGANAYEVTYQYDAVGNRSLSIEASGTVTYGYNAANELVLITPLLGQPTTLTWDACGNLRVRDTGGARTTYAWDWEDRLTSVTAADASVEQYAYSADGQRRQKVTEDGTINFLWDEENLLQERDAGLVLTAHYTDWPGIWGGLVSQRRGAASSFFGFDLATNTRILVPPEGVITDTYLYRAFGSEELADGSTVNPYRFGGEMGYYQDVPNRLYVRARHLDVTVGRWLTRDPLANQLLLAEYFSGAQVFAYVANNPPVLTDPSGLFEIVRNPCGGKSTSIMIKVTPRDRTSVVVGTGGTMMGRAQVFPAAGIIPAPPGRNCIAINGGFFGPTDYAVGRPATPVGHVVDCRGVVYQSSKLPKTKPPIQLMQIQTNSGSIYGRAPNTPGNVDPGPAARTGACVDNSNRLIGLFAMARGMTTARLDSCIRSSCPKNSKVVLLDGGGSTVTAGGKMLKKPE